MKKIVYVMLTFVVAGMVGCADVQSPVDFKTSEQVPPPALTKKGGVPASSTCTTIQDGVLTYSAGHYLAGAPISTGYDPFGYNYQGHAFQGSYVNVYLGGDGYPPYEGDDDAYLAANPGAAAHWAWVYRDVTLAMKWSDTWLALTDCDADGLLDRHLGTPGYIGSGAWVTNHMKGGEKKDSWTYFVKIVAVPSDATAAGGVWSTSDGTEIGPIIWGEFAILQEVESAGGVTYASPSGPGLGKW